MTASSEAGSQGPLLIAYDGSDHSRRAIERAGELMSGREAIVVTVAPPAPKLGIGSGPALDEMDKTVADEATGTASEGAELAAQAGFEATAEHIRSEPVWEGIVDRADRAGASSIVIGSKGRSGVSAVLLGSVATAVAQHTELPVLIVH